MFEITSRPLMRTVEPLGCAAAHPSPESNAMRHLSDATADCSRWLRDCALPLWATRGFDERHSAFEEQLDFSGSPVMGVARRLMVQARQVSVYAAAALSGAFPEGAALSLRAARSMIDTFFECDGAPGWAFSSDRSGHLVEAKRDLYTHAFAIFALAWAMRLDRDRRFEAALAGTLGFLERCLADGVSGGYWDCLPRPDGLRRQNAHMHLFEAYLALYETTRRDDVLELCQNLHELALRRFYNPSSGAIREYFDKHWIVYPVPGAGRVEPGHLFEWAWLLRRFEVATGLNQDHLISGLINAGLRTGLEVARGRVVDEIGEDGEVRSASSRFWPHGEAVKALTEETRNGSQDYSAMIAPILTRLRTVYCLDRLEGGWVDHVDADDNPISKMMPASTLYHAYFSISSAETICRRR
jgi:mannose/cellobiose epimerase-like protein (N-acyl-D-glucosamine 2-epimerase family)